MSTELVPYSDIEKMGKAVATSGLFGLKTQEQAIALMLVAQALGKHPALAAMEYNIIQGRPAKKAEAIQADFQAAGGKIEWHCLTDEKAEATFSHPQGGSLKLDWTIERAKKANLYDKDGSMYKKYPRQMLKARVVADGVRAVYPAAMGGVRAVEEIDDAEDIKQDQTKSRIENIIDAQSEVIPDAPQPATEEKPKVEKEKKSTAKVKDNPKNVLPPTSDNGVKIVTGLIEETPKSGNMPNPKTGKAEDKFNFKIGEQIYGTFDKAIVKGIMECVDKRILVKIQYVNERPKSSGGFFNDIIGFSQATADEVPF